MSSYTADQDDEITIKEGDIVDVITMETERNGWWLIQYGIQKGLAPSKFLYLIPSALPSLIYNITGNNGLFFV